MTVIVQAGHLRTEAHCDPGMRAASGAIAEAAWTAVVAPLIVDALTKAAVPARLVDATFSCAADVGADFGAVVALHYQANRPTESGFFIGTGDPDEDGSADDSARLAAAIRAAYEQRCRLAFQPGWNSLAVAHNELFEKLSPATPFCLVEAGVGWGADRDFLHSTTGMTSIAEAIAAAIIAFLAQPRAAAPVPASAITRNHTDDIEAANAQLHRETVDAGQALHAMAAELGTVRANCDALQHQLNATAQALSALAAMVRR
jgi:hypothetical protein